LSSAEDDKAREENQYRMLETIKQETLYLLRAEITNKGMD
jgi:hypothetical protein